MLACVRICYVDTESLKGSRYKNISWEKNDKKTNKKEKKEEKYRNNGQTKAHRGQRKYIDQISTGK